MDADRPAGTAAAPGTGAAPGAGVAVAHRRWAAALRDPVTLAIMACTALALGLRVYHLSRPGFLTGVTEYDDGPYFGSAVRLTQGILPYRDFVLVQPPGITLLMLPAALLAKITGTATGLAAGRVLSTLAGTAAVPLMGRLVRHRGAFATLVACGMLAVFPDSVAAAHTVLVEPWLVLFCLIGALLVFRGDRLGGGLDSRRGLIAGGVAFGFAGVIEAWAIMPVLVLAGLCLADPLPGRSRLSRAGPFAGGVIAGFCVPVLPFALTGPNGLYQSLLVAQVGQRSGAVRIPLVSRLIDMTGLSDFRLPAHVHLVVARFELSGAAAVWTLAALLVVLAVGVPAVLNMITGEPPAALEWFALVSAELVVVMLLWPIQFHYHFAAFLAPFLGLAIALPLARVLPLIRVRGPATAACWVTVLLLAGFTALGARTESRLYAVVSPASVAQAQRIIPPGACVVSDSAALLLVADRFVSSLPGCGVIDDGLGTDLALSGGLTPATGAARVPALARLWGSAFDHAQFVWLTKESWRRIAWPAPMLRYFQRDFRPVLSDRDGDILYRRVHGRPS